VSTSHGAAIPIPVTARDESPEDVDESVAPKTGVDVVEVAPPPTPATVVAVVVGAVVVVDAAVVLVVEVALADEPTSTSVCPFALEPWTPTATQSVESEQVTAESALPVD